MEPFRWLASNSAPPTRPDLDDLGPVRLARAVALMHTLHGGVRMRLGSF